MIVSTAEHKTREIILNKLPDGTLKDLRQEYGTSSISIRYLELSLPIMDQNLLGYMTKKKQTPPSVFHTSISSYQRGINEGHNGLVRRFIPKVRSIDEQINGSRVSVTHRRGSF